MGYEQEVITCSQPASELHFGNVNSQVKATVWKRMETACRLALIYRWFPTAKSNKSQHYGPLNSEPSPVPKNREKRIEAD